MTTPGAPDLRGAADQLAARLPALLARLAFNYAWAWTADGEELFASVDRHRWQLCQQNPVRLLQEAPTFALERAAADRELQQRARALEERLLMPSPPSPSGQVTADRPVAFFCAEYGVHPSLPIYAGGLGVLAGDILKAASDRAFPLVALGLMYHQGYFRQRIDVSGWQHEYWIDTDPQRLPAALVTRDGFDPLTVSVPIRGRTVVAQLWRIDVGRVLLYLLDADRPENGIADRWITARLYVGDRETRLAQYALLGMGGMQALRAMGADIVIAVDLGSDILGRRFRPASAAEPSAGTVHMWMHQLQKNLLAFAPEKSPDEPAMPSMLDVLATCTDIVQVRIARSRMAGEPPDITIAPRLARLRLLDFHRAKEAIEEGHRAVERVAHNLGVLDDSAS